MSWRIAITAESLPSFVEQVALYRRAKARGNAYFHAYPDGGGWVASIATRPGWART